VEHRNLPNVLLAQMLLKGCARLWCKRRAQRGISGMMINAKVVCWYLMPTFIILLVFYSVVIRLDRDNGPMLLMQC
jgi:hypothetical protein